MPCSRNDILIWTWLPCGESHLRSSFKTSHLYGVYQIHIIFTGSNAALQILTFQIFILETNGNLMHVTNSKYSYQCSISRQKSGLTSSGPAWCPSTAEQLVRLGKEPKCSNGNDFFHSYGERTKTQIYLRKGMSRISKILRSRKGRASTFLCYFPTLEQAKNWWNSIAPSSKLTRRLPCPFPHHRDSVGASSAGCPRLWT